EDVMPGARARRAARPPGWWTGPPSAVSATCAARRLGFAANLVFVVFPGHRKPVHNNRPGTGRGVLDRHGFRALERGPREISDASRTEQQHVEIVGRV